MSYRLAPETVRERETLKYYNVYDIQIGGHDASETGQGPHKPRLCGDTALTSFAQLGAYRLNCRRALISLFDSQNQYIVAEATRSISLSSGETAIEGDQLWLSCGAIKRTYGICGSVLTSVMEAGLPDKPRPADGCGGSQTSASNAGEPLVPVVVVPDLSVDERFRSRDFVMGPPHNRFYAGVPIQTPRGINIGVYCVFDDNPRPTGLTEQETDFLVTVSHTVMNHLEAARFRGENRRSERMVRGLGSFVEGSATVSGWWANRNLTSFQGNTGDEGLLDTQQQSLAQKQENTELSEARSEAQKMHLSASSSGSGVSSRRSSRPRERSNPLTVASMDSLKSSRFSIADVYGKEVGRVFDRAANVIRESIEVEGVVFFDGNITSFGGMVGSQKAESDSDDSNPSPVACTHEERPSPTETGSHERLCRVLAFSTSEGSSINSDGDPNPRFALPETFLKILLRRYPKGKVFNFDEFGLSFSSESDEREMGGTGGGTWPAEGQLGSSSGHPSGHKPLSPSAERRRKSKEYARSNEVSILSKILPGARSVIMLPLWDSHRQRWYAGALGWTRRPTRSFSVRGELSYLTAFGSTLMAQIARLDAVLADQAKSDVLGSISHELRSPLHGALGGVEMLLDTDLDPAQRDIAGIVETCSRTLLETIDHLLEYSKINNFRKSQGQPTGPPMLGRSLTMESSKQHTVESGMMSLWSTVDLALLAEEVLESVYAGHNFAGQQTGSSLSSPTAPRDTFPIHSRPCSRRTHSDEVTFDAPAADWAAHPRRHLHRQRSCSVHSTETCAAPSSTNVALALGLRTAHGGRTGLDEWRFHTQPGAIRRILMNLFGNALKYTTLGLIRVTLAQRPMDRHSQDSGVVMGPATGRRRCELVLTVADTGKGISEEYLRHHIYTPFSQEDRLAPGTGLGLSLVYHIVQSLGGHIEVKSRLGVGTEVVVTLALLAGSEPGTADNFTFEQQVAGLSGLKIGLVGFSDQEETRLQRRYSDTPGIPEVAEDDSDAEFEGRQDWHLPRRDIETLCRGWLGLSVVSPGLFHHQGAESGSHEGNTAAPTTSTESSHASDASWPDVLLITETEADRLPENWATGRVQRPAVVVICRTPMAAKARSVICRGSERNFEWTSQPCGPRKLARAITASLGHSSRDGRRATPAADLLPFGEVGPAQDFPVERSAEQPVDVAGPVPSSPANGGASTVNGAARMAAGVSLPASAADATPEWGGERSSFLLVEDNFINLKILVAYMKRKGYPHDTASDGLQALETYKLHHSKYRYILMDISMPVMDGLTASRHIRNFERACHIPPTTIIALTGLASATAQEEAFASGIDLFLTKPVSLKELGSVLEDADGRHPPA